MAVKYLICENCLQVIAKFDPDDVSIPVDGGMFISHLADRGLRPPWLPGVESQWMKCPVCPKRAFNVPDPTALLVSDTADGLTPYKLNIEDQEKPQEQGGYICPGCGKEYTSRETFDRYHNCPQGG